MTLASHGLPVLFTLFLWWFSTGLILYLDGLPRRTFRWSLAGASAMLLGALWLVAATADRTTTLAYYGAFSAAIGVWGWVEIAFLMGFVTGPRTSACPPGSRGWRRAAYAMGTILYHEFALLAGAVAILVLTWNQPNQLALSAYLVLWFARLSTKLNLFLGVRNLSEEFLPAHLRYLESYFVRRPMNLLFPLSLAAGVFFAVMLWQAAAAGAVEPSTTVALCFLATLVTLAVAEHLFLVLPFNFGALWEWGLASRRVAPEPPGRA